MAKRLPATPPVLAGYSYIRPLGVGGFADVFLFQQNMPSRAVAVKVLLQDVVDDGVVRMFNTEADVMARLSAHPSILTVFDASISADGRPYMVMEFCPASLTNRYRQEQISVAEVLSIGVKIASALETAHRAGLLHRDIKPSNVLITAFGSPVLADFGIAASISGSTRDGVFAMSVPWSAPEVVEERVTGSIATEVWGLGATLYTLLAGRSPFELVGPGVNARDQLTSRISRAKYTPIGRPDISPRLEQVLARSMSRDPAARQSSLLEFATELQVVQHELGLMPTPLEVAQTDWASTSAPVDFANDVVRGPVASTVDHPSRRVKPARVTTAGPIYSEEGTIFSETVRPKSQSRGLTALILVGAVVVVLAVAAVVAVVVLGNL